ncbi:putative serine/threonine-protein kinase drkD [Glandiceps talaboti]
MKAEYQGGVIVVNQFGLPERTNAPNYLQRELLRRYDLMKELQSNFMVRCLAKCCEPDQGNFWLLTEFMELQSLQEVLANQDIVLDWDVKTNMAYDVCHGLLNLHCRQEPMVLGKIGTDMFQVDQQKHVKLYDVSGVHTLTDSLESLYKAEDAYIPPEHLREKINGGKDEKYSLETESYGAGVVLFEIATRLPPFQGKTDREIYTFLTDGNLEELPVNCPLTYRVVTDGLRATDRQKRKSLRYAVSELNRQKTSQI